MLPETCCLASGGEDQPPGAVWSPRGVLSPLGQVSLGFTGGFTADDRQKDNLCPPSPSEGWQVGSAATGAEFSRDATQNNTAIIEMNANTAITPIKYSPASGPRPNLICLRVCGRLTGWWLNIRAHSCVNYPACLKIRSMFPKYAMVKAVLTQSAEGELRQPGGLLSADP